MRVPDVLLDCVCFLCTHETDGSWHYGGTAFFMAIPSETGNGDYVYLSTTKHNIEKATGQLYLRLNKDDGNAEPIAIRDEWEYSRRPGSDVAVTGAPMEERFKYSYLSSDFFLRDEAIKQYGIGPGDELAIIGLFTARSGTQRNLPIVRTGIIAGMPTEPFFDDYGNNYHAYLAEVRSIGGLSGSPVFVHLGLGRTRPKNQSAFLIGLVRSHWDYKSNAIEFNSDELRTVNMGMAQVTPIQDVLEILESEDFVRARREADRER